MESRSEGHDPERAREVKEFFQSTIDTPGISCGILSGYEGVKLEADATVSEEDFDKLSIFCQEHDFGVVVKVIRVGAITPHEPSENPEV